MKKVMISALTVLLGISLFSSNSLATETTETNEPTNEIATKIETPDWFKEYSTSKSEKVDLKSKNDNEYRFLHNEGKSIPLTSVNEVIQGEFTHDSKWNIVGVGTYELDGKVYTDFVFSNLETESVDNIRQSAIKKATEKYSNEKKSVSILAATNNYLDSYTYNLYDNYSKLAGVFTSNVEYERLGTGSLNGNTVSIWDVAYFNQSRPTNGYQTREIITRSTAVYSDQTIRSYGPFTTQKNGSASVSLSGIKPSFSWNFNTYDSVITDTSSIPDRYARWIFKTALGSNTAKSTYVMEPGVRMTNQYDICCICHCRFSEITFILRSLLG